MIYWDTSCVLKLYTAESDSLQWQNRACSIDDEFTASAILETEMAYALEQKEFRGEVKPGGALVLLRIFRRDIQAGRFVLYPVGKDTLAAAVDIAVKCYHSGKPIPLRTLDGLHLATAKLLRCRAVATVDNRMRDASDLLGIPLLSV